MQESVLLNLEAESHAIPFEAAVEALNAMSRASSVKVMFEMLMISGARLCELNNMRCSLIYGTVMYFNKGKNQHGFRKIKLPVVYLSELEEYRANNRVYGDRLFGISANTFRRYFNRDIRPLLSKVWHEKTFHTVKGILQLEYVLQLKGTRKSYATLLFAKRLAQGFDSSAATLFVSKDLGHSGAHITSYHYLQNAESLNIARYVSKTPAQILGEACQQRRLIEFVK